MATYKVVLEGTTLSGFDSAIVAVKLAALTKQSKETATKLLSGQPTVVKSGVDQATGLRYQSAFTSIGVASRIEPETLSLDLNPPGENTPRPAQETVAPVPEPAPLNQRIADESPVAKPQPRTRTDTTPVIVAPKRSAGIGARLVAIIMGFFSGVLIYFLAGLVLMGRGSSPSHEFVYVTLFGGWALSAYLMQKGAISVTKVISRGFLLGAAEWLLMIPAGMIFAGSMVASSLETVGSSNAAAAGAAIGGGIFAFLTGGVAVTMAVVCLIGFAVSYFMGREMKPEAPTATRKCPECAELIQPDAKKCRYCGAALAT